MKNPDVFQRKRDCNTCGQPDCNLGYPTPIGFRFFCSPICANVYLGYPLDFDIELDEQKYYFFESEDEDESNILPLHSKVRSYDFVLGDKILDDSNYMEGYIVKFAPVQNCSPDCNHYHIMTTRIIRNGVEVPLDDETWASFFTTHWDNAGILPLPDDPDDITKVKDAEEFAAKTYPSPYKNCVKNGFSLFGRKMYYDCRQAGSVVPSYIVNPESHGRFTYDGGTTSIRYVGVPRETHFDILDTVSNQMKPDRISDWREVFTETNKLIQESLKAEDEPENPKGPHYCDDCGHYYGRKVMIKGKDPKPTTTCLCGRKERARKMEDESAFGRKLKKLREEEGLSTNYYDKERPTVYDDYPREEPSGAIGTERRKEHWPPTSGMHWYDEIGEQMTFWTVPSWHTACIQCGIKSSKGGLLQVDEGSPLFRKGRIDMGAWEEPSVYICVDCVNESELLWWAITGAKPNEPRNPLLKGLLAESFSAETSDGNQVFNSCWKCGAGQHLWEIARFPATGRQISGVGGNPEEQINLDEVRGRDREVMELMSAEFRTESDEKFYMVHRHDANRAGLHFDLRLEDDGALKSWAIPKGMPTSGRHLAIQTPDHSMEYGKWEGTIKSGYGAGDVKIDTSGTYETIDKSSNNWKFKILTGKYKGVWRLTHWKENKWLISKSRGEN